MPNPTPISGVRVEQGNDNGKSIPVGSTDVLYTENLVTCVAILLVTDTHCFMIHSDSNEANGKGLTSLEQGIRNLGLDKDDICQVGLMGGESEQALLQKKNFLLKLLPKAHITAMIPMVDSAYLLGDGLMRTSKRSLLQIFNADSIVIIDREGIPTPRRRLRR